jgi:peptide/nickel transport system ATP-binding protein
MYLGRIVEIGTVEEVLLAPRHPYTKALIAAVNSAGQAPHPLLTGEPPDPTRIPPGCRFHPRCPRHAGAGERGEICVSTPLPVLTATAPDRQVACHLADADDLDADRPEPVRTER